MIIKYYERALNMQNVVYEEVNLKENAIPTIYFDDIKGKLISKEKAKAIIEEQGLTIVLKNKYGTIWDEFDRRKS